jgi:predicted RNA-binding Zn-ribbon protein involved in translation (DUF1610 family)
VIQRQQKDGTSLGFDESSVNPDCVIREPHGSHYMSGASGPKGPVFCKGRPLEEKPDIIEFLNSPAKENPVDELAAWMQFLVCPVCGAHYPDFHSTAQSVSTFCDKCGWSSEEEGGRA